MRTTTTGIIFLALLLGALMPLVAQDDIHTIMPGEENLTGGDYCFNTNDAQKVNALWHIVGSQWRVALAAPENELLRDPIRGKAREFVRDGQTFYSVMPKECFYVPAGMKARVPLFALTTPSMTTTTITSVTTTKAWWQQDPVWILIGITVILGLILVVGSQIRRIQRVELAHQEEEKRQADLREWERNNPTISGPPVVEGGFDAIPPQDRYTAVNDELARTGAVSLPGSAPREWKVVGDIVLGRIVNSDGTVTYGAGATPQERHFTDERAFRALMEHIPTGERHLKFVLWACMNGCWSNMVEGAINFVPDTTTAGKPVCLSPLVVANASEIARYGEPEYDARHDLAAAVAGRKESVQHLLEKMPRRSRVFVKSAAA